MPGRPELNALEAEIARQGGDDVIFDRIAAGESIKTIMADYGMARTSFYRWRDNGGEERAKAYEAAKEMSADLLVEQAGEILDDLTQETFLAPASVSLAKERASHRRWLAGVRKAEYGEKPPQTNVNLNLSDGRAFLEALKETGLPPVLQAEPVRELLPSATED